MKSERKRRAPAWMCSACGREDAKMAGQCPGCGAWNSYVSPDAPPQEWQGVVELLQRRLRATAADVVGLLPRLMQAGLAPEKVQALVEQVAAKPGVERRVAYLIGMLRQGVQVAGDGERPDGWERYAGGSVGGFRSLGNLLESPAPAGGLADVLVEEPEPACKACGDRRFVTTGWRLTAEGVERVLEPCGECSGEEPEERTRRPLAASGLSAAQLALEVQSLPEQRDALAAVEAFVGGEIQQLVLTGPPGRGKTVLATWALRRCIEAGDAGYYLNVARYLDELRLSYASDGFAKTIEPALTWPVVVLDDVGAERRTEWAVEKVYEIVDARYTEGLRTIACSNREPESWDDRVLSPLCDRSRGLVVRMAGADLRLEPR